MLYDLYEKQKVTEAKMAIYKAYTENDEMSKSMAMKDVLGWSDTKIKENFTSLIYDKQWTATADMMGERISEENPPVDIKSPMRLKKDVEAEEKIFAGNSSGNSSGNSGEGESEGGEESGGEEEAPAEEESPAEAAEEAKDEE